MSYKIAPSILAADFTRLGEQISEAEAAGADWIHIDVMDGHFVPNISLGPGIVRAVRLCTGLPLDVHLMIEAPQRYLSQFAEAGANLITVHVETCPHLHRTVHQIKGLGCKAGVSLNPATPVEVLEEILPDVDLILVLGVDPGFGGQKYRPATTSKISRVRAMLDERGMPAVDVEVDGAVKAHNIVEIAGAGATALVAGSAIYNERSSVAANIAALRDQLQEIGSPRPQSEGVSTV